MVLQADACNTMCMLCMYGSCCDRTANHCSVMTEVCHVQVPACRTLAQAQTCNRCIGPLLECQSLFACVALLAASL